MTYMYHEDPQGGQRGEVQSGISHLLDELQEGDCMVVQQLSAAAGSVKGFAGLLQELNRRGIRFRSVEEKFDTGTEQGRYAAEFLEQVLRLDEETAKPREESGAKGRKPIEVDEDLFDAILEKWRNGEITARQAMNELNLKPNTFYRRVKERMTDVKSAEELLNAAKKIGKEIVTGVSAEAAEIQTAAEKFAAEHDVEGLSNSAMETIGKGINAAGKMFQNLAKEFQSAMEQAEKKPEPAPETVVDAAEPAPEAPAEVTEDNDPEWI